jgi:hypothetical protein
MMQALMQALKWYLIRAWSIKPIVNVAPIRLQDEEVDGDASPPSSPSGISRRNAGGGIAERAAAATGMLKTVGKYVQNFAQQFLN